MYHSSALKTAEIGYWGISKVLFDELRNKGIKLITRVKKNMENVLMPIADKLMLLKRTLI